MNRYRINDHMATAAYAISVLNAIADGTGPVNCQETAEKYAQRHLDRMVAEGSIRVDVDES